MADQLEPGQRYLRLLENAWGSIQVHAGPGEFLRTFRVVPAPVGLLFAAHVTQSQVRNGGLHQYFWNDSGVLAPEAVAAFRAIGLAEWGDILAEAMRFFGEPYPRTRAARLALLPSQPALGGRRAQWDPFYSFDDRFYAWLHAEPDGWERAADHFAAGVIP